MTAPPHIAFANHKGGEGKTFEVQAQAAAAAEEGLNVLCVDMDAQGNLTRRLAAAVPEDPELRAAASLASVLQRPAKGEIERVLVPCGWGGIYSERIMVAPAHLELELLSLTAGQPSSERRLLTALTGVVDSFDVIMIDCPPHLLSHQIDNAWCASDVVMIPVVPEYDGIEAARRIRQRVIQDADLLNPDLVVGGFLINRYRQVLSLHQQRISDILAIEGPESVCPVRMPEAPTFKNMGELAVPLSALGTSDGRMMASLMRDQFKWTRQRVALKMGTEVPA